MELRNLITFIHVAELGSFTRAAEQLGYSQSTISFQIKQLEQELGCLLFERINHTVTLTERGHDLVSYAHRIRTLTDEFKEGHTASEELTGHIHIVTPDSVCDDMINMHYVDFHNKYPNISVKFTTADTSVMFDMLDHNKADIIITDIALQGMSGMELCRKINSDESLAHIPVIVVSAISSVETKMKCMEFGAMNYIEKPYSMDYLKACIKGALDKRATMRATYGKMSFSAEALSGNIINRDEDFLKRLDKIVTENMSNPSFSNKQLEEMLYMGHSTLNRKMKALLDTTPNDYIRTKRLTLAADMLEKGGHRVNEVCYAVGFNSPSYFAKCFKKAYGVLPAEWSKKK